MARVFLALLMLAALPAAAADDGRISFLEQEVRNLQRQVLALTRQVDGLTTRPGRVAPGAAPAHEAAPAPDSPPWVNAAKWRQLRIGMSELDVIAALGPPNSMREENGARVLLYALEVGSSGFLGGSITLRDRAVIDVRLPTLQ
jgi:hypothetical protein